MSPSIVSGDGDGLLLGAEKANLSCLELFGASLCSKELLAVGNRSGLLRIDVGELFPETGVVLSRGTFNGGKHAILSQ